MNIDLTNAEAIRSRYIGLGFYARADAIQVTDSTATAVISPNHQTYSEMGMPWIDEGILGGRLERPRIFTMLGGSWEIGAFYQESESFIKSMNMLRGRAWQGVLYRSGQYKNACRVYKNTKELGGLSKWIDIDLYVITLDHDFFQFVMAIVGAIVFGFYKTSREAFNAFLGHVMEDPNTGGPFKCKSDQLHQHVASSTVKLGRGTDEVDRLFSWDPEQERAFSQMMAISQNAILAGTYNQIKAEHPGNGEEQRNLLMNWCWSAVIHFISGHEIGHAVYELDPNHVDVVSRKAQLAGLIQSSSPGLLSESFSDWMGIKSCTYIAAKRNASYDIYVLTSIISMLLANGAADTPMSRARISTIQDTWKSELGRLHSINKDIVGENISWLIEQLRPAMSVIRDKLSQALFVNLILNPSDIDCTVSVRGQRW